MEFNAVQQTYQYKGQTRLRVVRIQAFNVILPLHGTPRNGLIQPLALYEPNGLPDERPLHTDRGHLVGLQFGGPERPDNLVPMYGGFNSGAGAWGRQFEGPLKAHLNAHGRAVNLDITISYPDATSPIPSQFQVIVQALNGDTLPPSLASPLLLNHPPPIAFYVEPDAFVEEAGALLQDRQDEMERNNWYVESQVTSPGRNPNLQVGGIPPGSIDFNVNNQKNAFYAARPYAVLDYIYVNYRSEYDTLGGPHLAGGFQNVTAFTKDQVMFVLQMNVVRSRGYIDSDLYGITPHEQIQHLILASTDYQAQVDHAMGRSGGGSNAYSNARVISAKLNKALNNAFVNQAVDQSLNNLAGI